MPFPLWVRSKLLGQPNRMGLLTAGSLQRRSARLVFWLALGRADDTFATGRCKRRGDCCCGCFNLLGSTDQARRMGNIACAVWEGMGSHGRISGGTPLRPILSGVKALAWKLGTDYCQIFTAEGIGTSAFEAVEVDAQARGCNASCPVRSTSSAVVYKPG